MAKSNV